MSTLMMMIRIRGGVGLIHSVSVKITDVSICNVLDIKLAISAPRVLSRNQEPVSRFSVPALRTTALSLPFTLEQCFSRIFDISTFIRFDSTFENHYFGATETLQENCIYPNCENADGTVPSVSVSGYASTVFTVSRLMAPSSRSNGRLSTNPDTIGALIPKNRSDGRA